MGIIYIRKAYSKIPQKYRMYKHWYTHGEHKNVYVPTILRNYPVKFFEYFRIDITTFRYILNLPNRHILTLTL